MGEHVCSGCKAEIQVQISICVDWHSGRFPFLPKTCIRFGINYIQSGVNMYSWWKHNHHLSTCQVQQPSKDSVPIDITVLIKKAVSFFGVWKNMTWSTSPASFFFAWICNAAGSHSCPFGGTAQCCSRCFTKSKFRSNKSQVNYKLIVDFNCMLLRKMICEWSASLWTEHVQFHAGASTTTASPKKATHLILPVV